MKTQVIVAAVIENSKGEILFGKQKLNRGVYLDCWHIPGGGLENGERIEDALQREIFEETGLTVKNIERVTFSDDVTVRTKNGNAEGIHMIFLDFKCQAESDNFTAEDDMEILKWVPKTNIKKLKLPPPSQHLFKKLGLV